MLKNIIYSSKLHKAVKWLGMFVAALAVFVLLPKFAAMQSQTKNEKVTNAESSLFDSKVNQTIGSPFSVADRSEQAAEIGFDKFLTGTVNQRNNFFPVNNPTIKSANSPDSGGLWSQQVSSTTQPLNAVHFLDENQG